MPLARFDAPFEHPDWIFEPKLDGFRAVAYVEGGVCRRTENESRIGAMTHAVSRTVACRSLTTEELD